MIGREIYEAAIQILLKRGRHHKLIKYKDKLKK